MDMSDEEIKTLAKSIAQALVETNTVHSDRVYFLGAAPPVIERAIKEVISGTGALG